MIWKICLHQDKRRNKKREQKRKREKNIYVLILLSIKIRQLVNFEILCKLLQDTMHKNSFKTWLSLVKIVDISCLLSYSSRERKRENIIYLLTCTQAWHVTFSSSCSPGCIFDSFTYLRESPAGESPTAPLFSVQRTSCGALRSCSKIFPVRLKTVLTALS